MLKKILFQIHWFLGITAGLILSIMGVTGAIYSYEQEILKWINQDSYHVTIENRAKMTPAEIYQHFQNTQPELQINSISIAAAPDASSTVNIVKEGERRGYNMMINPYTAAQLPKIQGREFFAFIQKLHRYLTIGDVGKQITGASALMLILFVLSGIYLRWPKKHSVKQWLAIKPKLKGRNFIWDLHAVIGTWVVIFYLIFAITGLYWSYDWWRNGMFKVLGVERPQPEMQAGGPAQNSERNQRQMRGENHNNATMQSMTTTENSPTKGQRNHVWQDEKSKITRLQIEQALNQTWHGFNQQFNQQYSTVTFNIPKKSDHEISVTFMDKDVQHERARNSATYNYNTAQFTDVKLYEDKKLNEKIMSSMLPVHRGSFFGPIYQFIAMIASLLMPLFFITGWILYIKRRKQKKLTLTARQQLTTDTINPNTKNTWLISYASQTGTAEQLAWNTANSLQHAQLTAIVKPVQQLGLQDLLNTTHVLFIASTYGTGEAPDLAQSFVKKVLSQSPDLHHLHYAVLALGSKEYPESYCSFGHQIDKWLQHHGAQALFSLIEVNNADQHDIQRWNNALAQATQLELATTALKQVFDRWQLSQRTLLNPNSLAAPAFEIKLTSQHNLIWQAGDIAQIQPENSIERIQAFLTQHHLTADTTLQNSLRYKDLSKNICTWTDQEQLLAQLVDLPIREYSIASIPSQQYLSLIVRQKIDNNGELGLGSGWLTQHAVLQQDIAVHIRNNPSFHLSDDDHPMICIANGTGIAGILSLLHTRISQHRNQNWLIFGERQSAHDFFYQDTIQTWKDQGKLAKLDLAFSRDQADKVYVYHKLQQHAQDLKQWIAQGAVIYVCGSLHGMASDVERTLIEILGEEQLDQLREDGRYKRDVY
ncbi:MULTISPECIES: sulfite reductase flavoprotein subunit alpha [unclassified Acinetobacter]|uniref:sulfite reductase flavoprotein subunit alpha n=1 Tax=unclassified Acinetobacter TaxID=196816 RepID=UPI002935239D|nr:MULTISPECIES: sulfite reductase flavoprotein subunit alpha [unclassified Acinetobacter]WOE32849.1 sulfite reductase flavoprotein subunit alpha [Acinetobacter sp. SAAs470]WOE38326.1 sulfite reductase flavoprotein subunit alpha [Acinetobacter sp. SAAs474]